MIVNLLAALLLVSPQEVRVSMETVDGAAEGVMRELRTGSSPALVLTDREIPLRDVLSIRFSPPIRYQREVEVVLADRSRIFGGIGEDSDESNLSFNGRLIPKGVRIPLEWIRSIRYHGFASNRDAGITAPAWSEPVQNDTVVTREGATLTGIVESVDNRGVRFEDSNLGSIQLAWEKILSVDIAPLDQPPGVPDDTIPIALTGVDRTRIRGHLESLDVTDGMARLVSPLIGDLEIQVRDVHTIELQLGRVAYLSARDPIRVKEGCPYISEEVFHSHFTWQRDRCVFEKTPLRIGDRSFTRGIGVHSECQLTFAVTPGDRRFQSWIGIDVTGRPNDPRLPAGSVVFRVEVDGEERFKSKSLSWRDEAQRVEVDLEGAHELTLVVEMGEAFHILDRADWGDARILRD